MAKASQLRQKLLTSSERLEAEAIISVRVPKSWRELLSKDGSITDKLLEPLAEHVRRLKEAQ